MLPAALVPTRPWEEILDFYRKLEDRNADFAPMRRLIAHVAAQPYAPLLFGATSMHALLVAHDEQTRWDDDVLRIEVQLDGRIRFAHQEQPFVQPARWACDDEKIVETLEAFLRRQRWVP